MKELDIQYLASLVYLAKRDNSDAFAELYALTYGKVYNYVRHYLRDDFLAQDALQEIYILALKHLKKLNDPTLFIAWLNRISFRVCFDMAQKKKDMASRCMDNELLNLLEDNRIDSNPEACFQKKDEHQRLLDALDQLPFQEHQVIVMRYFNAMKLEEIAAACEISRSTVKRYLLKGQELLFQIMRG